MSTNLADHRSPKGTDVRDKILEKASELFCKQGIRAVGVDLVVQQAGVAKTSLYRHFRTKDDLVAAYLERADANFWSRWDSATSKHAEDARAELDAQLDWIGKMAGTPNYRGCPQINIAAEFPEPDHPGRKVAKAHKLELRRRLRRLAERIGVNASEEFAGELALLINGALVSTPIFKPGEASVLLRHTAEALITADANRSKSR
jgi:AcrR family transcriptional regulator